VTNEARSNSRERILAAATRVAQAHGYSGLSFRDVAEDVGIRAASNYHNSTRKTDLGAAVARREERQRPARHFACMPNRETGGEPMKLTLT